MSAAFSAIIMVGAFVFPEVILGIMEASTILGKSEKSTPKLLSALGCVYGITVAGVRGVL